MTRLKRLFRALAFTLAAVLLLVLAALVVLNSRAFHRFVLAKLQAAASESTGGRVQIGDFHLRWTDLEADFYGVVIHGSEPASAPPLLAVDHLRAGIKIISLWRRQFSLYELIIDHPSICLAVKRNGSTNLPQPPPSKPGSTTPSVFDLAVSHFAINHGDVAYRDQHIPLDGDIHELHAQVSFDSSRTEYDGVLQYPDGRIVFGTFAPIQSGLQVNFGAAPSALNLHSLTLTIGPSTLSAQGSVRNYQNPVVEASYHADVVTADVARILKITSVPSGRVGFEGTLHFENRTGQPFLNNFSTSGKFSSPVLALRMPQARADVRAVSGDYNLSQGTLEARNVKAQALGGRVSGSLTLANLSEQPVARLTAAVNNLSLQAASAALGQQPLRRLALRGDLNGDLKGSWLGAGEHLQLQANATIDASAPVDKKVQGNSIPANGNIHLSYSGDNQAITLYNTQLATPHLTLKVDGTTGKQSSLGIVAQSDDLRELDQILQVVRHATEAGPAAAPSEPLGIAGAASFQGQLRGATKDLHLTGQLTSNQFTYKNITLDELRAAVALSPSHASVSQATIHSTEGSVVHLDADVALQNWSYQPQSALKVNLNAQAIQVATIGQLANLHYPVKGVLAARLTAQGTRLNLNGQGSVTLANAIAWDQPIQNLAVQASGAGNTVHSTLQISTPAGSGSGSLTYDFRTQAYNAKFNLAGVQLERLKIVQQKNLPVTGTVTASLQGQGTVSDPQGTAVIRLPKLTVQQQVLDGLTLHADVAHQHATFSLATAAQGASIQAHGNVALNGDYAAQAALDVTNIQLGSLLAAFAHQAPPGLHGQAELHASLQGPLKRKQQLEGEVVVPTINLAYKSLQIGNSAPIRAAYRNGVATIESCELKGTDTDVQVHATLPLQGARNLQASATGQVGLHLIQLLAPEWDTSGKILFNLTAGGALPHPSVKGTMRLENAALEAPGAPLGVQSANATFAFNNGRVDVQQFDAEVGGGKLTVRGFATFQPAIQFNLAANAERVRMRYPVGTRAILDSKLTLTGTTNAALLNGSVTVNRLSLTKDFDLSTFAGQFTGAAATSPTAGFMQNVKLDVSLRSASDMALASNKVSLQGSANLIVRGTAADPVILGRTDITGGEVFFNGDRFVVENGVIQFVNPVETEPVVNLMVTTTVNQFDLRMNFVGPLDRLRTTYSSDPPLAPIDIINLLATGQTTEASATNTTSPESVIAGQLTSQFSSRVEKLAGISSLTIDPQVGGTQGNGVGRLAIQQRVTKNLFFTFSTDLTTSTGAIVQVEYQATKRFGISTIRDQNGGYTVEVKVHKRF